MKIGIIGATGKAGNMIMNEAIERGHNVTAIVRNSSKLTNKDVAVLEKDLFDLTTSDLKQFDVVVNAFKAAEGQEHLYIEAGNVLINALKNVENTRLIVVGGAGSLFVDEAKTIQLVDTPEFPKEYFATASNMAKGLQDLQKSTDINWTFISPAAFFDPNGKRTGTYQKGNDNFIVNKKGNSYVSYADYAIALVDEIENPQHVNERFTLVSEAE
ncbi:NAD(P)-dependent oxidoreductase [Gottfriedia luciferensis]|uniref:NAD(P)-dependent oxidoreductase n=1 Tax=Gottfriedia luciferensis TaxID=178774 RepID=UPI000B451BBC|nr:NAD(P)-dependent oxidoreductase [Gottfriedia luciferensis]